MVAIAELELDNVSNSSSDSIRIEGVLGATDYYRNDGIGSSWEEMLVYVVDISRGSAYA
jgi:hypothetical protein